jgi:hypothetical protein
MNSCGRLLARLLPDREMLYLSNITLATKEA